MAKWRATLPLLIRDETGDSFRLVEIPSSVAYLGQRPRRIPDEHYELAKHRRGVDGSPLYILKNRRTERFVQLTEPEKFLWEQMNGRASVQDLGTAYVLRFGAFDFEVIPALIQKLFSARLLEMPSPSRLRGMLARNRSNPAARAVEAVLAGIEKLTVASQRAHDRFATLYRYGGFLVFSPAGIVALVAMTVLGVHGDPTALAAEPRDQGDARRQSPGVPPAGEAVLLGDHHPPPGGARARLAALRPPGEGVRVHDAPRLLAHLLRRRHRPVHGEPPGADHGRRGRAPGAPVPGHALLLGREHAPAAGSRGPSWPPPVCSSSSRWR